jgi:hypothetical protein
MGIELPGYFSPHLAETDFYEMGKTKSFGSTGSPVDLTCHSGIVSRNVEGEEMSYIVTSRTVVQSFPSLPFAFVMIDTEYIS